MSYFFTPVQHMYAQQQCHNYTKWDLHLPCYYACTDWTGVKRIGSNQLCELLLICYQLLKSGSAVMGKSDPTCAGSPMPLDPKLCICLASQPHLCYPNTHRHVVLENLFFYLFHYGVVFAMNMSEAHLQLVH